jgi:hypothetical protein
MLSGSPAAGRQVSSTWLCGSLGGEVLMCATAYVEGEKPGATQPSPAESGTCGTPQTEGQTTSPVRQNLFFLTSHLCAGS